MSERPPRAAVILGNDALVAARPCSAWQLAHACRAAGFDLVVPPTVGDELVAGQYLERLANEAAQVVVACHCPRARAQLTHRSLTTGVRTVRVAAPPIAAARALRLTFGSALLVTYVGDCPAADDPAINARFSPTGFLGSLDRQGIAIACQPDAMPAPEAARWQRYLSMPGGLPALRWLARSPIDRVVRDVDVAEIDGPRWTSSRSKVLLDLAEHAACACGGGRARIEEGEPLRATAAVVTVPAGLDLGADDLVPAPNAAVAPPPSAKPSEPGAVAATATAAAALGTTPPLPTGSVTEPAVEIAEATKPPVRDLPSRWTTPPPRSVAPVEWHGRPTATRTSTEEPRRERPAPTGTHARRRSVALAFLTIAVLAVTAALGMGVYAATSDGIAKASVSGDTPVPRVASPPLTPPPAAPIESVAAPPSPSPAPPTSRDSVAGAIAPGRPATQDAAGAASRPATPRSGRAPRRVEVVPGWMPQGKRTFTPADTVRPPHRDSASPPKPKPDTIPRA